MYSMIEEEKLPIITKHYAEVDENNYIISLWNDYIQPWRLNITSSYVYLGEWEGERPRLYEDGEDDPIIFDDNYGIPLYKIVDEVPVKRSEEELKADYPKIEETIPLDPETKVYNDMAQAYQEGVNLA